MAETNDVVTIEYNKNIMVSLEAGQTATLSCKDKAMNADLVVSVPAKMSDPILQEKTVTKNGKVTPDEGYDGLSKVIVNVLGGVSELPDALKNNLEHHLTFDSESAEGKVGNAIDLNGQAVTVDNYTQPGTDSFSASFWIKVNSEDLAKGYNAPIFTNKDWTSGNNPGYVFYIGRENKVETNPLRLTLNACDNNPDHREDLYFAFPEDNLNKWIHVICVVDRTSGEVRVSLDFGAFETQSFSNLTGSLDTDFALRIGKDYAATPDSFKHSTYLDDFMYFDKVLTDADVEALEEYYFYSSGSVGGTIEEYDGTVALE